MLKAQRLAKNTFVCVVAATRGKIVQLSKTCVRQVPAETGRSAGRKSTTFLVHVPTVTLGKCARLILMSAVQTHVKMADRVPMELTRSPANVVPGLQVPVH